ncbi:hypothetical protein F5876DRAFT_76750 [Lentinula aff. lateritia]|uniref:Uncharacterized protein n=1 Tax=Lentinula aff. lateritia TaxID=2804960 RepID=A0ACC1U0J7_9AGAR|nr:hypothetical protein F5876DRAFT_76750 [Lentinula aff. lateritia]
MSLASGPVGTPALYDPAAPLGSRWSNSGFSTSSIARLYHSSVSDASVLIAGSNLNVDVNLTTYFPTTYQAKISYPAYFSATTRPIPSGIPTTLSYGGDSFDITVLHLRIRARITTRLIIPPSFLQLNDTYTVNSDGSLTLHTVQMPPNPNIFQPGPAMVFVVVNGIPSNGTFVIVGSGNVETQATAGASVLPASVLLSGASGSADGSSTSSGDNATNAGGSTVSHTAVIVGTVVAGIIILGVIGALIGVCASRRRRAAAQKNPNVSSYAMSNTPLGAKTLGAGGYGGGLRSSDSSAFSLQRDFNDSQQWSGSSANLTGDGRLSPYHDAPAYLEDSRGPHGMSMELDPYAAQSRMSTSSPHGQRY